MITIWTKNGIPYWRMCGCWKSIIDKEIGMCVCCYYTYVFNKLDYERARLWITQETKEEIQYIEIPLHKK